jgi:hypothetical protein
MTMKLQTDVRSVQLEPWELITLRILLDFEKGFPPAMLKAEELLYKVSPANISSFLTFLVETFQEFNIKTHLIEVKGETKISFEGLKKLAEQKSSEQLYEVVKSLIIFVDIGDSKGKIRNRLNQKIAEFKEGITWSLLQFQANPYTYSFQKTNFLKNIPNYTNKYGQTFQLYSKRDFQLFGDEQEKTNFTECLLVLEYEGLIGITGISFFPIDLLDDESEEDLIVYVKMADELLPQRNIPPTPWKLSEEGTKAHIKRGDQILFTFPSNTSNQFKYFKCLWNNYGKRVTYKEVYEFESNFKYPDEKGKNWRVNDLLRNAIRKLKREFSKKKAPIQIVTNRGFTLTTKTA